MTSLSRTRPSRTCLSSTRICRHVAFAGLAALMLGPAAAQAEDPVFFDLPAALLERLGRTQTEAQLVERMLQELRQADVNGDGLDQDDLSLAQEVERAQARAGALSRAMGFDLDGDGTVTQDEVARVAAYQSRRNNATQEKLQKFVDGMVKQVMAADRDGDGKLTIAELLQPGDAEASSNRRSARSAGLLELDLDGDGRVTESEVTEIAQRSFRAVDYDGDGTLSNEETKLLAPARSLAQALRSAMPCDLPPPGDTDQVVVFGAYDGDLQPTVTIAGQDTTTSMMRIEIEPGDAPLYLVLEAQFPTIWQFSGAIERLSRVAVMPGYAGKNKAGGGTGLIGVPQEKIAFLPAGSCGKPYHDPTSQPAQVRARVVEKLTARPPAAVLGVYSAKAIRLPSGVVADAAPGNKTAGTSGNDWIIVMPNSDAPAAGRKWKDREDSYADPANIVAVDPADVIAPVLAQSYEVLPNQYGLRQLVEEGKLERTDKGYRIVKPIPRFPPGLTGAHYAAFILPQGMPMPAGDSGHSEIILEAPGAQ